jgi:hypothetical protein
MDSYFLLLEPIENKDLPVPISYSHLNKEYIREMWLPYWNECQRMGLDLGQPRESLMPGEVLLPHLGLCKMEILEHLLVSLFSQGLMT